MSNLIRESKITIPLVVLLSTLSKRGKKSSVILNIHFFEGTITEKNSDPNQRFGCIKKLYNHRFLLIFKQTVGICVQQLTEGRENQNTKKETWLKLH